MAKSKQIIVKESEETLYKLRLKQPAHLRKRIDLLLVSLWRSFIAFSGARLRRVPTYKKRKNKAFATRVVM